MPVTTHRADHADWAVEAWNLSKRFGERVAVDGVDLRIPHGVAFGYLGPEGAGKTTLLRVLLGHTTADAGETRVLGRPVSAGPSLGPERVGAMLLEPQFAPYLTGREILELVAAARTPAGRDRIEGALERVGLVDQADEPVGRYSPSMRRRFGVARLLLDDPLVLFFDEPAAVLDAAGIQEFGVVVRRLVAEGRTVVLTSQLLDEVANLCDHVAILDRGRVVLQGRPDRIAARAESILVTTDDRARAGAVLSTDRRIRRIVEAPGGLRVTPTPEFAAPALAADVNRRLVEAGVAVHGLEPSPVTLEQRFLEATRDLVEAA